MILSRRQFIQTGLAGSLLLSFSGWLNAAGADRVGTQRLAPLSGDACGGRHEGSLPSGDGALDRD